MLGVQPFSYQERNDMALPTQEQMRLLRASAGGEAPPVDSGEFGKTTYAVCEREGWLEGPGLYEADQDRPPHLLTDHGRAVLDRGKISAAMNKHNIRFPDELWYKAEAKARRIGTDMTTVARTAYEDFVRESDAKSARRLGARLQAESATAPCPSALGGEA